MRLNLAAAFCTSSLEILAEMAVFVLPLLLNLRFNIELDILQRVVGERLKTERGWVIQQLGWKDILHL